MPGKMIHLHYFIHAPVEMIGDIGYLPDQILPGVADYFPKPPMSTSNLCPQEGHVAGIPVVPSSLILR